MVSKKELDGLEAAPAPPLPEGEVQGEAAPTPEQVSALQTIEAAAEAAIVAVEQKVVKRTGRTFDGHVIFVPCPLYPETETSPQLEVGFRVDRAWRFANEPRNDDGMGGFRRAAGIVRGWRGWDFVDPMTEEPIPSPNPDNLMDYVRLYDVAPDLVDWIPEGYKQALELSLPPN